MRLHVLAVVVAADAFVEDRLDSYSGSAYGAFGPERETASRLCLASDVHFAGRVC